MKKINGKKVPCSKKKRIQNKYIPKGIYCHDNCLRVCPYWSTREATDADYERIYELEVKGYGKFEYHDTNGPLSKEDAIKYMKTCKDKDFFKYITHCALMNYDEYIQSGLLWDQCKECGRNEKYY